MADAVEGSRDATIEEVPRSFDEADVTPTVDGAEPAVEEAPPAPAEYGEGEEAADSAPIPPSDEVPPGSDRSEAAAATSGGRWLDKLHPTLKKHAETIANHPYVTRTADSLRQRAGTAQERLQPLVNHPYVQKGTGVLKAGGTKTLETGKKVYNREEGYEPKRFIPFFAAVIGLIGLGLLLRGYAKRYYGYGQNEEL